jgi:hypothetical protein
MGLPIAALARLVHRLRLPASAGWRLPLTVLLMALLVPVFLTAAVATVPVLLTVGLAAGVRRAWQWQAQRLQRRPHR